MKAITTDTFFDGQLQVKQYRDGYRFSIDAVLLAGYASPKPGEIVLDLGTGCGILPLILAYRHPDIRIWGVEIQDELAEVATINARENRLEDRITIICEDMISLKSEIFSGSVDMVVCNPPYRKVNSGRINPNPQRAIARHEIQVTLHEVVETASRMLNMSGRFVTIFSVERTMDILSSMRECGLEPKHLRSVHSFEDANATLVLLTGIKGGRPGMNVEPPLIIYKDEDTYTEEVRRMFLI